MLTAFLEVATVFLNAGAKLFFTIAEIRYGQPDERNRLGNAEDYDNYIGGFDIGNLNIPDIGRNSLQQQGRPIPQNPNRRRL